MNVVDWVADYGVLILGAVVMVGVVIGIVAAARSVDSKPVNPAAPGWYRDAAGTIRWWDGHQWTGHTAP